MEGREGYSGKERDRGEGGVKERQAEGGGERGRRKRGGGGEEEESEVLTAM